MTDDKETKKRNKNKGMENAVCGYPFSMCFIVVSLFCERFAFHGVLAVLVLYFKYFLHWDDDLATSIYHTFVALCFLTPVLGAIVADSWLGKFKTIIYLSVVSIIGQVALAVSTVHDITDFDRDGTSDNQYLHVVLSMMSLLLIALGTGGIRPCMAAFGGEIFHEDQEKQRKTFFSIYYLSRNCGTLLSFMITPILRAQECGIYSQQSCYPLAFGVPAAVMVVALVVFAVGSGMYCKAEPQGNIMLDVCKCIGFAIKNHFRHRGKQYPKRQHWMDWSEERYSKLLIAQIKMVLKVLFLYIPLPMFWTLYYQKGSRWTLQATTMDGNFGLFVVQPDQMQTLSPVLILTLVPIMDSFIYPLIKKCGLNFTPHRRMTVGMLLAVFSFVCAALVQMEIDKTLPTFPSASQSQLKLLYMGNDPVKVKLPHNDQLELSPAQASEEYFTFDTEVMNVSIDIHGVTRPVPLALGKRQTLLIPSNVTDKWLLTNDLTSKSKQGSNAIRFVNGMMKAVNVSTPAADFGSINPQDLSIYSQIPNGMATFTLRTDSQSCEYNIEFGFGGSYTFYIPSMLTFGPSCQDSIIAVENIKPNSVHMALQIPQYFLVTAGEVMFSITGVEFSYSQAPSNMKAVLQAGWLFTAAIGNLIVLTVAEIIKFPKQWIEYIFFASLLVAICIVFSIMACFYTYIDSAEIEAEFKKKVNHEEEGDRRQPQKTEGKMVKCDSNAMLKMIQTN